MRSAARAAGVTCDGTCGLRNRIVPDFVVDFLDAHEGTIGEQEAFIDHSLSSLLLLLGRRIATRPELRDCRGLSVRPAEGVHIPAAEDPEDARMADLFAAPDAG